MKVLLRSEKIRLAVVEDWENGIVQNWLNDPEVCKYNSHAVFPSTPFVPSDKELRLAIWGAKLLGVISLKRIDWVNRNAELAILIGETDSDGHGYGTEAARLICRHGFEALNLHRIYCGTHADNIGMQKLAVKIGMTEEGRTRQALYKNGVYADAVHFGMTRKEFDAHCSHLDGSSQE